MNRQYEMVREFHRRFGAPLQDRPAPLGDAAKHARAMWMREEIDEFLEADDICGQADAMIDLIYFALGTMAMMGVKPDAMFDIVHEANMTKLFPDGKPHYNQDNKVIKPPGWQDPEPRLRLEIDRQSAECGHSHSAQH